MNPTTRRTTGPVIVAALAVLAALLTAPAAVQAQPVGAPELAGTTTITFDGTSAMQVRLPAPVTLTRESFEITLEGATGAFALLSPRNLPPAGPYRCRSSFPEQNDGDGPGEEWCQDYSVVVADGWFFSPYVFMDHNHTVVSSEVLDMSVVTDGVLTLTIRAPELEGEARYAATGHVDGGFVELPRNCPAAALTGCDNTGFGGHTFDDVTPEARVGTIAFAERPNRLDAPAEPITPGFHNVGACVYPSARQPEASSDADDYPFGCDPLDPEFGRGYAVIGLTQAGLGVTYGYLRAEYVAEPGPRYVGYAANQYETAALVGQPGLYGAYGHWVGREITCPSRNWTAC
jgi:hypothetical protein